ncbi:hypothetical protein OAV88_02940, partial [bacterium]|nr:hypothetical protein [bacterium]
TLFPIVSFTNSNLDDDALSPILKPKKRPIATHSSTFRTDVSLTSSKNNSTTTENNTHRSRTNSEPFFKKQFESIRVGVIAMDKKMKSKAMQAILSRMKDFTLYKIGTQMLMNEDVSRWPKVDVVMFKRSSADMPMSKILEFCKLHRPLLINDIATQHDVLSDRRLVYETLQRVGVPVPEHFVMNRDGPKSTWTPMEEYEDYIVVDGERVDKPFVEKPVSGDDHNIYIYYPSSSGGGSKRMFRKRKNRSSQFYPDVSTVRREGSYIYEAYVYSLLCVSVFFCFFLFNSKTNIYINRYMHTNGTDVKVYTVGPQYAHAEARKAPTLDGIVVCLWLFCYPPTHTIYEPINTSTTGTR